MTLKEDKLGTQMTKSMLKSLKTEASYIDRTPKLVQGMTKLKQLHLLISKDLNNVTYIERRPPLDITPYHNRKTNSGFARGFCGRLYTR